MKNLIMLLVIVASSLLYSVVAFPEEKAMGLFDDSSQYTNFGQSGMKDECLIVAKNCIGGDDGVLKRVERLNNEIEKGTSVYTPDELNNFQEQLNWIYYESGEFPAVRM